VGAVAGVLGYLNRPFSFNDEWARRTWLSLAVLSGIFLARALLVGAITPRIDSPWARYLFRKVTLGVLWVVALFALLQLWILNWAVLPVTLGLLAAGLAVAFQRPIMSILGLFVILVNRPFRIGDRIEIKGIRGGEIIARGDVIDLRALYTSLMEVGEWMGGDVYTGRIMTVPNYRFLENEVANSTKEFGYIWDIVTIPITFSSDWRKARLALIASIEKVVGHMKKPAQAEISQMSQKYVNIAEDVDPRAYITIKESWIELGARYLTVPRGRRTIRSRIQQDFLERIRGDPDICLASPQLRVYNFPPEDYRRGLRGILEEDEGAAEETPGAAGFARMGLLREEVGAQAAERPRTHEEEGSGPPRGA